MDDKDLINNSIMMDRERKLGIYVHIPFCIKKCDYCDFLSAPATEDVKKDYVDALLTEIESYKERADQYTVPTIFFGGGTPSCLEADDIRKIMDCLKEVFKIDKDNLEATIEVNPGTVTKQKLQVYHNAGFNRLSFGLQSVDNKELKLLGRIHTYEQFLENYRIAREAGFSNINIDLISALPGHTVASWTHTLEKVIDLNPEHISAYGLIIEEGTKFYERYKEGSAGSKELPDEDTDREIYRCTGEILEAGGYRRYEISNYAKPGFECRHNSSYWLGTEYLGIGLGASSLLNGARFINLHVINQYIRLCKEYKENPVTLNKPAATGSLSADILEDSIGLRRDFEQLTMHQRMEEFMFLGLRMCDGINKTVFSEHFHIDIASVYGEVIDQLEKKGLLTVSKDRIRLTDYGIDVSNSVLSVFLLN